MTDIADINRFDALMKAAEFRRQVRQTRVGTTWRVTLAAWALILAIGAALRGKDLPWILTAATVATVVLLHVAFVWDSYVRNENDATKMWKDYDDARKSYCRFLVTA